MAHDNKNTQPKSKSQQMETAGKEAQSKSDPEVVARAFEFGSVALDVPATAFSMKVEEEQQHAARNDLKGVAEVLE